MKRFLIVIAGLAALALTSCSGSKVVPVSGVVKVNGVPYKNAVVSFQPIAKDDDPNPGRGSAGETDENGHFTLVFDGTKPGALVGRHRVRIFTKYGVKPPEVIGPGENQGTFDAKSAPELIPSEWNEYSKVEFTVPSGGTDSADFNIEVKVPGR